MVSWFLWLVPSLFLVAFALPLLVAPLWWAARLGWEVDGCDLAVYLGRCTGGLALCVIALCYRAAADVKLQPAALEIVAFIGAAMVGVHAFGAWRKIQPWTETAEIPLYVALAASALWLRAGV